MGTLSCIQPWGSGAPKRILIKIPRYNPLIPYLCLALNFKHFVSSAMTCSLPKISELLQRDCCLTQSLRKAGMNYL